MTPLSSAHSAVSIRRSRSDDLAQLLALVGEAGLITDGVSEHITDFWVAEADGRLVGSAGLEVHGDAALLRSVAVTSSRRGEGLGRRLVGAVLAEARERGMRSVALLTETAGPFFSRLGFHETTREDVDPRLLTSVEFTSPSCATALVMSMILQNGEEAEA